MTSEKSIMGRDTDKPTPEQRVGARAEQKRRWDRENVLTCPCGNSSMARQSAMCQSCERAERRRERDERYREIQRRWKAGESMTAISEALGFARGTLAYHLSTMRDEGWDVPLRHRGSFAERPERQAA